MQTFSLSRIIPASVNVTLRIESLKNIEEVKMSFSAKFTLETEWFEWFGFLYQESQKNI